MTSDDTHQQTDELLTKNKYFGMQPDQVHLLKQVRFSLFQDDRLIAPEGSTVVACHHTLVRSQDIFRDRLYLTSLQRYMIHQGSYVSFNLLSMTNWAFNSILQVQANADAGFWVLIAGS
jgi:hypothetical protein